MKKNRIVVASLAGTLLLLATACNVGADPKKGMGDAGVQQGHQQVVGPNSHGQQDTPADIINFSDKYPNVEFKCNGVDGLYVNTRSSGYFVVVPNDPQCR